MTGWLLDTLLWTAVLIGFVLLIRRPVARWFGPQIAYALWALPMIRLLLPPIQLPRALAPEAAPEASPETVTPFLIREPAAGVATPEAVAGPFEGSGTAAHGDATSWTLQSVIEAAPEFGLWFELALMVWLTGAATFVYLRFAAYFRLRAELLGDAREVGRSGRVRLVETPGTSAPLAFGVLDPVIALPQGFMALTDRTERDLALAHEFQHHRGRDLLINIAVQPLFALHWWNPLGRYGWLALRRDQEAACDARVMASRPAEERAACAAAYAKVIAGFAAGPAIAPRTAITAPMACPVLGDKSIIQRLRSLTMSDLSPRRRLAGHIMLGAAVLALPLTASISYAENGSPEAPSAILAPGVNVAPSAPAAPGAPTAPMLANSVTTIAPEVDEEVIIDEDGKKVVIVTERIEGGEDGKGRSYRVIRTYDSDDNLLTEEVRGAAPHTKVKVIERSRNGEKLTLEQREVVIKELRAGLAEAEKAIKDVPNTIREAMIDLDMDMDGHRTVVKMECRGNSDEVATVEMGEGSPSKVYLCQSRVMAQALSGLEEARKAIARNPRMDKETLDQVLEALDAEIKAWKSREG